MFMETVYTPGVAHLSYVIGDGGKAAVIDPRRDAEIYVDIAYRNDARIAHIFETHRNEDYVVGSVGLAQRTGASIHHGHQLDFRYGEGVREGDRFQLGKVGLSILETPGHTFESVSIVYRDLSFGDSPLGVFTGDALFVGDVGRTDFFPDRAEEVAGLLYDSIFEKLLPLGDQVLLWPAHGAGSVCGSGMADRNVSTLGYERRHNPALQKASREDFVRHKVEEHHYQPPYFKRMETYNLEGPPLLDGLPRPKPLSPDAFDEILGRGAIALDVRSAEAYAGAHVPRSLSIQIEMVPAFAGYFLPYDRPIALIAEAHADVDEAVRHLVRMGYDRVVGFLAGGMHTWETSGRKFGAIPAVHIDRVEDRLDEDEPFALLDVRSRDEFRRKRLRKAVNIYVGELPQRLGEVPQGRPVTTFCGSGQRAMIAASFLRQQGVQDVEDCLGSMSACRKSECDVVESK